MDDKLEDFIRKIPEFLKKTNSEMIVYFAYYWLYIENIQHFNNL